MLAKKKTKLITFKTQRSSVQQDKSFDFRTTFKLYRGDAKNCSLKTSILESNFRVVTKQNINDKWKLIQPSAITLTIRITESLSIILLIYDFSDKYNGSYLLFHPSIQMQSPELTHCDKKERVCIFKIPPLSTSKGYYLDDWKQMIWEGGCKVTEKDKVITITYIAKDDKIFAQTKVPSNHRQAIVKTIDSSRGYAVRLQKPGGGYLWIGTVFRDRNDAFDFGVIFQQFSERQKLNKDPNALKAQFAEEVDFSLKKGQKIKVNVTGSKSNNKTGNSNADFFNEFKFDNVEQKKQVKKPKNTNVKVQDPSDWFSDFSQPSQKKQKKQQNNLLDF